MDVARAANWWQGLNDQIDKENLVLTDKIVSAFGSLAAPAVVGELFDKCLHRARPDYLAGKYGTSCGRDPERRLRTLHVLAALMEAVKDGLPTITDKSMRKLSAFQSRYPDSLTLEMTTALSGLEKMINDKGLVYTPTKPGKLQKKKWLNLAS